VHYGIFNHYSSPTSPISGQIIVGNLVDGYHTGYAFSPPLTGGGVVVTLADNNHAANCTRAVYVETANQGTNRHYGVVYAETVTDFFRFFGGGGFAGKVVGKQKPTNLVSNGGYANYCPSTLDGFAYPIDTFSTIGGGGTRDEISLFNAGANNRFFGRLKFQARRTGVADWVYVTANVHWDGTTLTITSPLSRVFSASGFTFSSPTFNVSGSILYFRLTSSAVCQFGNNWCEFDGEYWDA
jgi:hypothetical protein